MIPLPEAWRIMAEISIDVTASPTHATTTQHPFKSVFEVFEIFMV